MDLNQLIEALSDPTAYPDPVAEVEALAARTHPRIPLPRDLYAPRRNSSGVNLAEPAMLAGLAQQMEAAVRLWSAAPVVGGRTLRGKETAAYNPADRRQRIGTAFDTEVEAVTDAGRLAAGVTRRSWR